MVQRRIYDHLNHIHFVTFSCYRRRRLLQQDQAKRIVIGQLGSWLAKREGLCLGFVIMLDHVHALIWFPQPRGAGLTHQNLAGKFVLVVTCSEVGSEVERWEAFSGLRRGKEARHGSGT